jgi:hypothetical protein
MRCAGTDWADAARRGLVPAALLLAALPLVALLLVALPLVALARGLLVRVARG